MLATNNLINIVNQLIYDRCSLNHGIIYIHIVFYSKVSFRYVIAYSKAFL